MPTRIRYILAAAAATVLALIAATANAGTGAAAVTLDPLAVYQADRAGCVAWLAAHPRPLNAQHTRIQQRCDDDAAIITALAPTQPPTSLPPSTVVPTTVGTTPSGTPTVVPTTASPSPTVGPTTTSPTPTSTGLQLNCLPVPSRCGYPDATNTGVPPGTPLTVASGIVTLSVAGQVYDGMDVSGCIRVTAPNVTIRNSRVTCTSGVYSIDVTGAGSANIFNTTVSCGDRGNNSTGIGEGKFTATRVNVGYCENGFDIDADAIVQDTYCHDLAGNDDDCIQGTMTNAITIVHNSLIADSQDNSAIEAAGLAGWTKNGLDIENNLLSGGGFTLYCPRPNTTSSNVKVIGNRFGTAVFGLTDACATGADVFTGNYRDATGAPVNA